MQIEPILTNAWLRDVSRMHKHFKHAEVIAALDHDAFYEWLAFRADFIQEELDEFCDAIRNQDAELIVDSLIDLVVVALGTIDGCKFDAQLAWHEVMQANFAKESGANASRPNAFNLPDLVKPKGWVGPCHDGNHGRLVKGGGDDA